MKCESCGHEVVCYIHRQYMDVITIIARITDAHEPEYSHTCECIRSVFNACTYYKETEK